MQVKNVKQAPEKVKVCSIGDSRHLFEVPELASNSVVVTAEFGLEKEDDFSGSLFGTWIL